MRYISKRDKNIIKLKYPTFIFYLIIFSSILSENYYILGANIDVGTSIITNECGTLGINNPLRLLDCSIFKLSKGMCCLLTITQSETVEEDGIQRIQESYKTACIIMQKIDGESIRKESNEYKKISGDVLIECSQKYIKFLFIFISLFICLMF